MTTKSEKEQEKKDQEAADAAAADAASTDAAAHVTEGVSQAPKAEDAKAAPSEDATAGTQGFYQGRPFEVVEVNVNKTLHLKGKDASGADIFVNNVKPEWFTPKSALPK